MDNVTSASHVMNSLVPWVKIIFINFFIINRVLIVYFVKNQLASTLIVESIGNFSKFTYVGYGLTHPYMFRTQTSTGLPPIYPTSTCPGSTTGGTTAS